VQTEFLRTTVEFYRAEAQDFIAQNTCPEYLRKASLGDAEYFAVPHEPCARRFVHGGRVASRPTLVRPARHVLCQSNQAENRLAEEHARVNHSLSAATEPRLRARCEQELIATHARALIDVRRVGVGVGRRRQRP
jgi:hypothetical protein